MSRHAEPRDKEALLVEDDGQLRLWQAAVVGLVAVGVLRAVQKVKRPPA